MFNLWACVQDLLFEMQQRGAAIGSIEYTRHHIRAF
jgi:hypothetical protein